MRPIAETDFTISDVSLVFFSFLTFGSEIPYHKLAAWYTWYTRAKELIYYRLLAVPFWIVERASEIAERASYQWRCEIRVRRETFPLLFRTPSRLSRKGLLAA